MALARIKRLCSLLKQYRTQADDAMERYADFLEPGLWKSSADLVFLYKKDYEKKQKHEESFLKHKSPEFLNLDGTERLSRRLFAKFYRFHKRAPASSGAGGQLLSFTSRGRTVKVIDSKNNTFLTVYQERSDLEDYLRKREIWAKTGCFPVPPVLEVNLPKKYVKEAFLQKDLFSPEDAFAQVLTDYKRFFESVGKESARGVLPEDDAKRIMDSAEAFEMPELGRRALSYLQSEEYRINLSHGDVNPPNLIYSGGKYYYIDFETVGQRYFFYDILYYMAKSFADFGSDLLQDYLKGEYDESFAYFFTLNGCHYRSEDRFVYLFVFEMLFSDFGKFPLLLRHRELWQSERES